MPAITENEINGRLDPFNHSNRALAGLHLPSGYASVVPNIAAALSDITYHFVDYKPSIGPLRDLIDLSRPIKFVMLGFGNLAERFTMPALANLHRDNPDLQIDLIATDIYQERDRKPWLDARRQAGIPFRYVHRDEYLKELPSNPPDIFSIATPPTSHYADLQLIVSALPPDAKTIVAVEKPFTHLDALEKTRAVIQSSPFPIYDTDFFNQGKAFLWLMTQERGIELLSRFGKPLVVNGNCVETMREWREWMFNQEVSGGGALVDCGSHNSSMMYNFMHRLLSQSGAPVPKTPRISQALFAEYHGNPASRETYNLLQINWDNKCIWNMQDGKALPKTAYNLEAFSENGSYLLVSVGTEFHPPYVLFVGPDGKADVIEFTGPGVGYEQVFERLLVLARDPKSTVFPDPAASLYGSMDALLAVEKQAREYQARVPLTHYNPDELVAKRTWPGGEIYLPVTDDAFGKVQKLPGK